MEVQVRYEGLAGGLSYAEKFRQKRVRLIREDGQEATMMKDFMLREGPQIILPRDCMQLLPIHSSEDVVSLGPGFLASTAMSAE